jgi:hypothetical protein
MISPVLPGLLNLPWWQWSLICGLPWGGRLDTEEMGSVQMKRQKIHFTARVDTDEELEWVAARVGQALNCTFAEGEFQRWYAQVAYVFGLKISVSGVDIGSKKVARLTGGVAEEGFLYAPDGSDDVEYDRVDISAYVVDLLTIRTGLQWYRRPTPEDHAAERRAIDAFDDMLGGVGSQGAVTDDGRSLRSNRNIGDA